MGKSSRLLGRGLNISIYLAALALLPLLGLFVLTGKTVASNANVVKQAEHIDREAVQLVELAVMRSDLIDERHWAGVEQSLVDLGVSAAFVGSITGIDIASYRTDAVSMVDSQAKRLTIDGLEADIAIARSGTSDDLNFVVSRYDKLEDALQERSSDDFDSIFMTAGEIRSADELVRTLRVLEQATIARQALGAQAVAFSQARFDAAADPVAETIVLDRALASYQNAIDELDRIVAEGSEVDNALEAIVTSPDSQTYFGHMRAQVRQSLVEGVRQDQSIEAALSDIETLSEVLQSSRGAAAIHIALVDAAGRDVAAASRQLVASSEVDTRSAMLVASLVAVAALLMTLLMARLVAQPLSRLAERAQLIRDGEPASGARLEGPAEVRKAGLALNEAAANIKLVEEQANALATGEIHHPSLTRAAAGDLGSSLQAAVQTLRDSIRQRDSLGVDLQFQAAHDGLTELPNRTHSVEYLTKMLSRPAKSGSLAVFFIDLDRFKTINDRHGHLAGDMVLTTVAQRLIASVRPDDHVGRFGGDEFVVVADSVDSDKHARELAERILESLCEPVDLGNAMVRIDASIGIAMATDGDETADELLRDADLAVYEAKRRGRSTIEFCNEELLAAMLARAELDTELRQAIEHDELTLLYQPVVETETKKICGVEALVRWNHPVRGWVMPDEFVPIAEMSELIIELDRWVVKTAIGQIETWTDNDLMKDITVAVNVSSRTLSSEDFIHHVRDVLIPNRSGAERLIVELTEGAILKDPAQAAHTLQQLRSIGVQSAIDDFGTGYTSLAVLRTLPIDILKIDRSFTQDETAESLLRLIIDTGHLLGARVIAEGIETLAQADHLTALGADELQGFYYSKPVTIDELGADLLVDLWPAESAMASDELFDQTVR